MRNEFLKGNDGIRQALADAHAHDFGTEQAENLIAVLRRRIGEDGHLLIPVELLGEDVSQGFRLRSVPGEDGAPFMACFTREEELNKGEPTAVLSMFADVFFNAVVQEETVGGIVIDPWSDGCALSKAFLRRVLEE